MKAFMDKDFLLETPTAQHLYHDYSAKLPIVDYQDRKKRRVGKECRSRWSPYH